jgi:hypothetical protein
MAACGYSGTGGIGAKEDGISEALIGCLEDSMLVMLDYEEPAS